MDFDIEKLIAFRKKFQMSISAFSRFAGISRSTVYSWEKGKSKPSDTMIKKLNSILEQIPKKVSEKREKKSNGINSKELFAVWKSMKSIKEKNIDSATAQLSDIIKFIGEKFKQENIIRKSIFKHTKNLKYIKDKNQQYIYVNEAFLEYFIKNKDFKWQGRTDYSFFSKNDAIENEKEDKNILLTGRHIQKQGYIPGTRKKKYGFVFKSLLTGENGETLGILCEMFDVTYFNHLDNLRKILQKYIDKMDIYIWMGKGLSYDEKGYPYTSKTILRIGSKTLNEFINKYENSDEILNGMPIEEGLAFRKAVPEHAKKILAKQIDKGPYPIIRFYHLISPYTKKGHDVLDFIYFEKETETMFGIIFPLSKLPPLQTMLKNEKKENSIALKKQSQKIALKLKNLGVSEDIINKAVFDGKEYS